jgi:hypothetical protein
MSDASADVSSSVEYGRNKFVLDRVPWAMWFCVGGLAAVLHTGGANGATRALVGLAMLGLGVAGLAATLLIIRWGSRINDRINGASVVGVFLALGLWGIASVVHLFENPRPLIYQQLNAFGWMAIYLGCGYIAYALFRHFYPEGPVIQLSQSGILFNRPWLRLFVPWQDIQEVGRLDDSHVGGLIPLDPVVGWATKLVYGRYVSTGPDAIVVVVTNTFYERDIASKRRFLAPPGSKLMFQPKGAMMQVVLNSPELVVAPEDFHASIEARWKAFRDRPPTSRPQFGAGSGKPVALGTWSFDGSWRQAIPLLAPLAAAAGVILHASGFWWP